MQILLIEPTYKNKYPPLGLMKIATFHKQRGDAVRFIKGLNKEIKAQMWDRIYITTLFSFYWHETINTIRYYEYSVKDPQNLFIGGPMATLMADEIEKETGYKPIKGLLNEKGKLRLPTDYKVDSTVPDYSILEEIEYKYPASNAYFAHTTRGCIRKCPFCAVPKIEPFYTEYVPLKKQIKLVNKRHGEKKDLLLLDNNVLASSQFDRIIDEIKEVGFYRGAKLNNRNRYVDFNQGIDLRLLTKEKMRRLAELSIKPLRIAFDHIRLEKEYVKRVEWASEFGIDNLSNYILYNFHDTLEDFYRRLEINVDLNERLGTKIFSFPMKYIPIDNKDRKHVGKHWNHRYLRGIQCILQATHGVVSPKREFFHAAFGRNVEEFKKLLLLPDNYIIFRKDHENNGAADWEKVYDSLSNEQQDEFHDIVFENQFTKDLQSNYSKINTLLAHYKAPKQQGSLKESGN